MFIIILLEQKGCSPARFSSKFLWHFYLPLQLAWLVMNVLFKSVVNNMRLLLHCWGWHTAWFNVKELSTGSEFDSLSVGHRAISFACFSNTSWGNTSVMTFNLAWSQNHMCDHKLEYQKITSIITKNNPGIPKIHKPEHKRNHKCDHKGDHKITTVITKNDPRIPKNHKRDHKL